jgi:hypothetical protein
MQIWNKWTWTASSLPGKDYKHTIYTHPGPWCWRHYLGRTAIDSRDKGAKASGQDSMPSTGDLPI